MLEVRPQNLHNTVQKLKNKSSISILTSDCNKINVCDADVEVSVVANHLDWRADLLGADDLCSKGIGSVAPKQINTLVFEKLHTEHHHEKHD